MDISDETVLAAVRESATSLGYLNLKEKQVEAACQLLLGKDTFVALPTGKGNQLYLLYCQELLTF